MSFLKIHHIAISQEKAGQNWHTHTEGQIYFMQQGLTVVEMKNTRTLIPPGRIGWIPPETQHRATLYYPQQNKQQTLTGLSLYLHPSLCTQLPQQPVVIPQTPFIKELFHQIYTLRALPWQPRKERLIAVLVDEFNAQEKNHLLLTMPKDKRLMKMASGILKHPEENISLEQWAQKIAYSPRSIRRKFIEETGMNVTQWRQIVRLEKAMLMLGQGASVTEAAIESGYDSVSSFIKMFKKTLHITPAQLYAK